MPSRISRPEIPLRPAATDPASMATGGGDDDDDVGFCHRKKRCHGSGGDVGDDERSRVAAGDVTYDDDSESGDDGAGDSMEDCLDTRKSALSGFSCGKGAGMPVYQSTQK